MLMLIRLLCLIGGGWCDFGVVLFCIVLLCDVWCVMVVGFVVVVF